MSDNNSIYFRYETEQRLVEVPHLWAVKENFTLKADNSAVWSEQEDFSLAENLGQRYLNNSEINIAMADIENQHPDIAEFLANDNEWSMKLHALQMGTQVISSYCSQLYVTDILLEICY